MIIFKKPDQLTKYVKMQRETGKGIAFVPTMGALHEGHLSLLREARKTDDLIVFSIFVNPTQFNNPEDLKHYPVAIEKDIELLTREGCNVLLLPSVIDIYPSGYRKKHYDLGSIENTLEGLYRPGHF